MIASLKCWRDWLTASIASCIGSTGSDVADDGGESGVVSDADSASAYRAVPSLYIAAAASSASPEVAAVRKASAAGPKAPDR